MPLDFNHIPHVSELDNIESNFKIYAGPGAGKTTWLCSHLEDVLKKSTRLGKTGKIACITYTNVAAEEISGRIKIDKQRFDISTIHSFLYRNIVKPFSYLIETNDNGEPFFNIEEMDGHDEHIVLSDRIRRWINSIEESNSRSYQFLNWAQNKSKVLEELSSLDYVFNNNQVELISRKRRGAPIPKSNGELWVYKSKYWKDGIMHHEDVLYFAYLILNKSPRILEFIRNKFPYIFIDEFQDTTELQTWIVKKISEQNTIVGVVGDLAQSIYKFTGAKRSDFEEFDINGISDYKLTVNHRSTKTIIQFLNQLRNDINQTFEDGTEEGVLPLVLIGSVNSAKQWFENDSPDQGLYILTRKNAGIDEINNQLGAINRNLLRDMYGSDSNSARVKLIHSILMAHKFHNKKDFKNSMNELLRPMARAGRSKKVLNLTLRKIVIDILNELKKNEILSNNILAFYTNLKTKVKQEYGFEIGSGLRGGAAKTFYENHSFEDIIPHIKIDTKSDDLVRTIHSSKGTEFNNVMIHFDSTEDFRKYIFDCSNHIDGDQDDARINYVGCSRAMKRLLFNIPEVNDEDLNKMNQMNINHHILP